MRISQICTAPVDGHRFEETTAPSARSNWLYESQVLAASLRNGGAQRACMGTHTHTNRSHDLARVDDGTNGRIKNRT